MSLCELRRQLRGGGERRERDDDGADARCGQHRDDPRGAVGVQQPDMGALARAESDQAAGQVGGAAVGLGVAEALGVAHQQRMVAATLHLLAQHLGDRGLRHVRRHR